MYKFIKTLYKFIKNYLICTVKRSSKLNFDEDIKSFFLVEKDTNFFERGIKKQSNVQYVKLLFLVKNSLFVGYTKSWLLFGQPNVVVYNIYIERNK